MLLKRSTQFITLTLVILSLMAVFGIVRSAAPPNVLTYQGRVLNTNGVPSSSSSLTMKFFLYDASTSGTCIWSNDSANCDGNDPSLTDGRSVSLTTGLFTESLGDTSDSYAAIADSVFGDNTDVYLEVDIAGETLSPRKRLTSAPYAINAQRLDGIDSTGFLASTGDTGTGIFDLTGATLAGDSPFVFEGATADDFETTFTFTDPTGDNVYTFKDGSGTIAFTSDITSTGLWEDGASGVYEDDEAVIIGSNAAFTYASGATGDLQIADELEVMGDTFIDNDLVVGASTSSTETLSHTSFSLGGDDLFVAGTIGVEGVVYSDGGFTASTTTTFGAGAITTTDTTDLVLTIAGGDLTFAQNTTIGDGGDSITINTSDWDISATGDLSGIGTISTDGDATLGADLIISSGARMGTGSTADSFTALEDDSLFVEGAIEVDGAARFDSTVDIDGVPSIGADITFDAATPNIAITNGETFTVTDGTNTLFSLVDGGSVGDLTISGDLTVTGDDLTMTTNTSGFVLVGDGTNYNPVDVSGDVDLDSSGAATIQADAVALSTDTTGNYVATVADSGSGHLSVSGSGSEGATVTLGIAADILDFSELSDSLTLDASTSITMDSNDQLLVTNGGTGDIVFNNSSTGDFVVQDGGTPIFLVGGDGTLSVGGATTFVTDVDLSLASTENLEITNTSATADVIDVIVVTASNNAQEINLFLDNDGDADSVSALVINATSADTDDGDILIGLNIGNLSSADATVTELGMIIGSGWDANLFLNDTSSIIRVADTGVITFTDGDNTLMTLTDNSDVGDLALTGDLAVNGDDISSDSNLTVSATGYVRIGDSGTPGSASSDDALYVEGALEVDATSTFDGVIQANGDTTFTLSETENIEITNTDADAEGIDLTISAADNDAQEINFSLRDDANVDTLAALDVNVTSASTGDADNLFGILIANLTSGDSTVNENALVIGSGWDANLVFSDTSAIIEISDAGVFTWQEAGGGNSLMTLTDNSDVGDLVLTGDLLVQGDNLDSSGSPLVLNATTSDEVRIGTGTPDVATGAGDLYATSDIEADGNLNVAGSATVGSIVCNDCFDFSEFADALSLDASTSITMDSNDQLLVTNGGTGNVVVNLSSTGDFVIQDNGTPSFTASDNGTFTFAGGVTFSADATAAADLIVSSGARIGTGSTADSFTALEDDSLFVEGAIEVDGAARFDSTIDINGVPSIGADITFDAATPNIAITNEETFTITDGTNTLFSLADGGTVGNATISGTLDVNGDIIRSDGNLRLNATGYVWIGDDGTPGSASSDDDLYVYGGIEVDATTTLDGVLVANGDTTFALAGTENIVITNTPATSDVIDLTVSAAQNDAMEINLTLVNDGNVDTVNALEIRATSADTDNADKLRGINVASLGSGDATVTEVGIRIGNGWDRNLAFADTTAIISLLDTGVITWTETGGDNTLMTLTDNSDVGDLALTGDLAVNGDTITSDSNLMINAAGYVHIGDDGTPGVATGDDALYIFGDLEVDATTTLNGLVDITGDTSIKFTGAENLVINNTTATSEVIDLTVTSAENDGQEINFTLSNDSDADTLAALDIEVRSTSTGDADSLFGLLIGNLSNADSTVNENALVIGSGWDANLVFSDTSAIIEISDAGVFTWQEAGGGNSLMTLTDNSDVGDLVLTGDLLVQGDNLDSSGSPLVLNATTSDEVRIGTGTPDVATGAGDLYATSDIEADGNLNVAGSATIGSIVCNDCFDFSEFADAMSLDASTSITMDSNDRLSFINDGTDDIRFNLTSTGDFLIQTSGNTGFTASDNGTFTIDGSLTFNDNTTHTLIGAENIEITNTSATSEIIDLTVTAAGNDAQEINFTLGNDDDEDTISALDVNVTSAATGDGDVIRAINIADLASADGTVTETALAIGTGWDTGIFMGANSIVGTTGLINYTNFDVLATGAIQVDTGVGLDTNASGALSLATTNATSITTGNALTTFSLAGTGLTTLNVATANTGAATLNLGTSNEANVLNLGTGTAVDDINIGGGGTGADDIDVGDALADVDITGASSIVAGTGDALTITAHAASTWSTDSGQLNIRSDSGSGAIDLYSGSTIAMNPADGNDLDINISGTNKRLHINASDSTNGSSNGAIVFGYVPADSLTTAYGFYSDIDFTADTEDDTMYAHHIDLVIADDSDNTDYVAAINIALDQNDDTVAGGTGAHGVRVLTTGLTAAGFLYDNNDTSTTVSGVQVQSTGGGVITSGLDVSDSAIVNAVNAGNNFYLYSTMQAWESSSGVITWEDTGENDMMTLTDAGSSGNLAISGTLAVTGDSTFDGSASPANAGVENLGTDSAEWNGLFIGDDGDGIKVGEGQDYVISYDSSQLLLEFGTETGASDDTENAMYTFAVETNNGTVTANQEVFEIGRQAADDSHGAWVELFAVDEDGDTSITGDFAVNGGSITSSSGTVNLFETGVGTSLSIGGATPIMNFGNTGNAQTFNIAGVGASSSDTINIATKADGTDDINIGNSGAQTSITGDDWSITDAGVVSVASITCADCFDFSEFADAMSLDASTSITMNSNDQLLVTNGGTGDVIFNLSSTGDFQIQDAGNARFGVSDSGVTSIAQNSTSDALSVIQAGNGTSISINSEATTADTMSIDVASVSGTLIDLGWDGATTQTGAVTALDIDINTNIVADDGFDHKGVDVALDALTANGSGTTTNITGYEVSGGALDSANDATPQTIAWYGIDIAMPAIDTGDSNDTTTAYGIRITPGGITNGAGTEDEVGIDMGASKIDLDDDNDTSIIASTDDQIIIEVGGSNEFLFDATAVSPGTADTNTIGSITNEWSQMFLGDSATALQFGTGQDITIGIDTGNDSLEFIADGVDVDFVSIGATANMGHLTTDTDGDLLVTDEFEVNGDAYFDASVTIVAAAAPTEDLLAVTNTGFATTTADVNAASFIHSASNISTSAVYIDGAFASTTNALTYNILELDAMSPTNSTGTDNVNGLSIGVMTDPGGTIKSSAIAISSGWDIDASLQNSEFLSNSTDGKVRIGGSGGASDVDFIVDLDNAAGPIIETSTAAIQIDAAITVDLNAGGGTSAVCHSGGAAATNDVDLDDCTGAPAADYAEQYPVATDVGFGDIVVPSSASVVTKDGDEIVQLVKSSEPYTGPVVGIVSDNYGDFTSAGYNLSEEDNPMPVALVGRVPVKVTAEGGSISVGDYLTTSSTPGAAMRATKVGRVIGMALSNWDGVSETVMVQVNNSWYMGDVIGTDGVSTLVTDNVVISELNEATAEDTSFSSYGLALRGSAWDGSEAQAVEMMLQNVVEDEGNYRLSVRNTSEAEVAYITNEGTMRIAGDMVIGGNLYPSDRGVPQTEKYIYYDGSEGAAGDFMRTNAKGWSTGSYDFAEMFPSTQELTAGELVAFSGSGQNVQRATGIEGEQLAGIVSTRPGFLAGENVEGAYPIALAGRVPTRVSTEGGAITVGDPLTISSSQGIAMKAQDAGIIVGYALEAYEGGSDNLILTYVNLGYWIGDTTSTTPGTDNSASGFASSGTSNFTNLNMSGNVYMGTNSITGIGRLEGLTDVWSIESDGTITTKGLIVSVAENYQNEPVETVAVTSPEVIITLSGTAELVDGEMEVRFEQVAPEFNDIISAEAPIRVVVTPSGPVSLYVSEKDQNHFIVKRFAGEGDVEFDWMVTAYRRGYEPEEIEEVLEEDVEDTTDEPEVVEDVVVEEVVEEPSLEEVIEEVVEEVVAEEPAVVEEVLVIEPVETIEPVDTDLTTLFIELTDQTEVDEVEPATPESPDEILIDETSEVEGGESAETPPSL